MGKKIFLLLLFAVLVVVAAFVLSPKSDQSKTGNNNQGSSLVVEHVDLNSAKNNSDKLPEGMPTDIPMELASISESYKADYKDKNAVQYTISYRSTKSVADKYREYLGYMADAGYSFGINGKDELNHSLYGTKDNDDLSVVMVSQGPTGSTHTLVQLTYLDRQ